MMISLASLLSYKFNKKQEENGGDLSNLLRTPNLINSSASHAFINDCTSIAADRSRKRKRKATPQALRAYVRSGI